MKDIIKFLQDLDEQIEQAKKEKATIDGRQSEILKQLQESFDVKTIEDAEDLLEDLTEDMGKLDKKIQNKFLTLTAVIAKNAEES
mgnify:CR=1 FL=1